MKGAKDASWVHEKWTQLMQLASVKRLSEAGIAYLRSAMEFGPTRQVGAGALFSNSGRYPMGDDHGGIDYESEGPEPTFILSSELSGAILVLSQPVPFLVRRHDVRGRLHSRQYTPDFLAVWSDKAAIIEVKPLERLVAKEKKYPDDWARDREGKWRFLPGESAARGLGFEFEVFYPELLSPQKRANLRYLVELRRDPPERVSDRILASLRKSLSSRPRSIRELLENYTQATGDQLIAEVLYGRLWGSIDGQTIGPEFILYGSAVQRDAAVDLIKANFVSVGDDNEFSLRLLKASSKERARAEGAMREYHERRESGVRMNTTDYRRRNLMAMAVSSGALPIAGLVPDYRNRGGKGAKTDQDHRDFVMKQVRDLIKEQYGKLSPSALHTELEKLSNGTWHVPTIETLRKWIAEDYMPERLASVIGGARMIQKAKKKTEGSHCIERTTMGGMLAHCDAVYIDNKQKEEKRWNETRPIVFAIVMAGSNYVPAAGILLGNPSALGYAMAMRICIRDHGFLPVRIVNDRGPEFENDLRKEALGYFDVEIERRAIADSRAGSHVESFNRAINKFLQTLPGGTYYDQKGRDADAKLRGNKTAVYSAEEVIYKIHEWIDAWNTCRHGGSNENPKEMFERQLTLFPRSVRKVTLDENAAYVTSYPIKASAYRYQRGLPYSGKRYACDVASELVHRGDRPTGYRIDSMDPSIIWAKSSAGLLRLTSNQHHGIAGMGDVKRIIVISKMLRHHRTEKRNQAEFRRAQAVLRKSKKSENSSEKRAISDAASPVPDAKAIKQRPSFSEIAKRDRSPLPQVLKGEKHGE